MELGMEWRRAHWKEAKSAVALGLVLALPSETEWVKRRALARALRWGVGKVLGLARSRGMELGLGSEEVTVGASGVWLVPRLGVGTV